MERSSRFFFVKKVRLLKIYKWSLLDGIKWAKFINKILRFRVENIFGALKIKIQTH